MRDTNPFIQELIDEVCRETTLKEWRWGIQQALEVRFGTVPLSVVEYLSAVADEAGLRGLLTDAVRCASLDDFQTRLASLPAS